MDNNHVNFWQDHSIHYLEMALGRDRCEVIEHPDGYGKRTGDCGDTAEMFLTIRDDRIHSVSIGRNSTVIPGRNHTGASDVSLKGETNDKSR